MWERGLVPRDTVLSNTGGDVQPLVEASRRERRGAAERGEGTEGSGGLFAPRGSKGSRGRRRDELGSGRSSA